MLEDIGIALCYSALERIIAFLYYFFADVGSDDMRLETIPFEHEKTLCCSSGEDGFWDEFVFLALLFLHCDQFISK